MATSAQTMTSSDQRDGADELAQADGHDDGSSICERRRA